MRRYQNCKQVFTFFLVFQLLSCSDVKETNASVRLSSLQQRPSELHELNHKEIDEQDVKLWLVDIDFDGILDSIHYTFNQISEETKVISSVNIYASVHSKTINRTGEWDAASMWLDVVNQNGVFNVESDGIIGITKIDNECSLILFPGFSFGSGRESFDYLFVSRDLMVWRENDVIQDFHLRYENSEVILAGRSNIQELDFDVGREQIEKYNPWILATLNNSIFSIDSSLTSQFNMSNYIWKGWNNVNDIWLKENETGEWVEVQR